MLVYDITNQTSFSNVNHWLATCEYLVPTDAVLVLVGNKCDMETHREVPTERGRTLASNKLDIEHEQ